MSLRDWFPAITTALGWLAVVLLAIDRWVHKQDSNDVAIIGTVAQLKSQFDRGSEESSKAASRTQGEVAGHDLRIRELEKCVARLEALDEARVRLETAEDDRRRRLPLRHPDRE